MKIVSNLTGKVVEQKVPPSPVRQTVLHQPRPGVMQQITLGDEGVVVKLGKDVGMMIPIAELVRFAESVEPMLTAAQNPPPKLQP